MRNDKILNFRNAEKIIAFVKDTINTFGYEFRASSRYMSDKLGNISYITIVKYFEILEESGCVEISRPSRRQGNVYRFKPSRVKRLFEDYKADKEIQELFKNGLDFNE